ncbi:hypothetical protein CBER1_07518 [Cercospora berteroae]|uniref:Uncharacterized protein n=1 Tax=Cercospora berteroae TaxID=357750 RepID=A0A2S6BUB4_9PEZI|nr:hypothetical protein CBER1_07518 [Cercospora berteroae]
MSRLDEHTFGDQKRKRPSQENSFEEEIAWTTARCNRLLRTINSRIEAIRQLLRPDIRAPEAARKPHTKSRKQKPESLTDPAWLPNGAKKPRTQTYAGSRKAKVSRPVRGTEANSNGKAQRISLPSPFLKRVQTFGSDRLPSSPLQAHDVPDQTRQRKSLKLPVKIDDPVEKAEDALRTAFQSFLSITRPPEPVSRQGASSLLQTCLRKVPEYIESQDEAAGEDTRSATLEEVWSFFDDLVEIKGPSWQGLREVVRSQGLNAIRWAIFDGVLSDDCVGGLVNDCTRQKAYAEVETLLDDFYQRSEVVTPLKIALVTGGRHTKGMRFRIWRRYIEQAPGRILALTTAHPGLWNTTLHAVIEAAQDDAFEFLQVYTEIHAWSLSMSHSHDFKSDNITENLDEVASKLLVMASTSLVLHGDAHGQPLRDDMYRLAVSLLLQGDAQTARIGTSFILVSIVLTAISSEGQQETGNDALLKVYEHLTQNLTAKRKLLRREQEFAALVATDFVSLYVNERLNVADAVLVRIKKYIVSHPNTATTAVLRQIAMEILTHLRIEDEHVENDLDHSMSLYIARETRQTDSLQTPRAKSPLFGWDGNLCDWVWRTPFTQQEEERVVQRPGPEALLREGKENVEPETPDVLAKSVVKVDRPRIAFVQMDSAERSPLQSRSRTGSPQVIVARPVKRRKSDRLERKRSEVMQEDCSEDELAV